VTEIGLALSPVGRATRFDGVRGAGVAVPHPE
jgi:hypothetical protein